MAKFELNVYDMKTEKKTKTLQRNMMSVSLFIKFQELSEKLLKNEITGDAELFQEIKPLFTELFVDLTADECDNCIDPAEAINAFNKIIKNATKLTDGNEKN